MKNYQHSDYALNKFSEGIVYRFSDRIVEVTLSDYLAENPDRTEQDFRELKAISDGIYLDQVRDENAQTKKNTSLSGMEAIDYNAVPIDEAFIEACDQRLSSEAVAFALESGALTDIQRRRFAMYFLDGLSTRKIADKEGATQRAIVKSIHAAIEKIIKVFTF